MKRTIVYAAILSVGLTAAGLAATGKIRFAGLRHVAAGSVLLNDRLVLSNIGASGEDGVDIHLGKARGWTARNVRAVPSTLDWTMTFEASGIRGRSRIRPALAVRELHDRPNDRFLIGFAPSFGASTYRVEVYSGVRLVFAATDLTSGSEGMFSSNDAICDAIGKSASVALGICEWVVSPDFRQNDNGECEFEIVGQSKRFISPDGGEVVGDRIRFVENLSSAPQRAIFRRMHIRATDLRELSIDDETIERRRRRR